jgi:nicotinate-nucleotide adenylyltransferase
MMSDGPLGIIGGTFDPVHFGHLRLAEEAAETLGLGGVIWLPAGQPPHRQAPGTDPAHRLAMVRLAIAGRPGFSVDSGEIETAAPSYTVNTLQRLRGQFGEQRPLVLLLGSDAFAGLADWHRWRELFGLAHIAVATRPGFALATADLPPVLVEELRRRSVDGPAALGRRPAGGILDFAMTPLAISATALRRRLSAGGSARYLLPDGVLDYIRRNHLYSA